MNGWSSDLVSLTAEPIFITTPFFLPFCYTAFRKHSPKSGKLKFILGQVNKQLREIYF